MKKRILFIDHDCRRTGSTVSMIYLLKSFVQDGYKVFVLTPKDNSDNILELKNTGAETIQYGNAIIHTMLLDVHFSDDFPLVSIQGLIIFLKNILKFIYGIAVSIRAIHLCDPHIVYVNEYVSIQASIAGKLLNRVTAIHIRSLIVKGKYGIRNYLISKAVVNYNDIIFTITQIEAEQFKNIFPINSDKLFICREFLDHDNFTLPINIDEIKREYDIPINMIVILMMGGISSIKGTKDFLNAARVVIQKYDNVFFVLAGHHLKNGSRKHRAYYNLSIELIKQLVSEGKIKIIDEIAEIQKILSISDVLISPSTISHFSRPVIEAWAMRKTVILTNTPHNEWMMQSLNSAISVEIESPNQISSAIENLITNISLQQSIRDAGYELSKEYLNSSKKIVSICNRLSFQI